jgi:AcrR family transcriptional regulator
MNDQSNPRRARSEVPSDTREQLLWATRRCVRDKGLAATTSRDITGKAGVNLAAITYHFGSKDELVAEALFGEIERRVRPALDRLADDGDPTSLMLQTVQELLAEFERSRRDTPVYFEALLLATRDARYRRRVRTLHGSITTRLAGVIAALRADGFVPAWVEPDAMASLILSVANGVALQTRLDPTGPDHTAMAGQFASLLVAAGSSQPAPDDARSARIEP